MDNPFHFSLFFSIEAFHHKELFSKDDSVWMALVKIEDYIANMKDKSIDVDIPSNVYLENVEHISIGKGTIIEQGAYIRGPCIIGEDCTIRHGAYLRGNIVTGNRCVIGHSTEVKNSIFLDDANAAHFAYVGDSILGNRVNLGAGVKCANFRLDKRNVTITANNKIYKTGLNKFGSIIGDDTQIGCNSVTSPGTLLQKNVICYPCLTIFGYILSKTRIKCSSFLKKNTDG